MAVLFKIVSNVSLIRDKGKIRKREKRLVLYRVKIIVYLGLFHISVHQVRTEAQYTTIPQSNALKEVSPSVSSL